ncbi:MAG TPA: energy-coupling factor transporter transmembrane component T [Candidatus Deferrimicrobiaceae bacterium]|nr:energy-coupling factor transporter transmembrane component T [Candidatus Deferrimicrobiaceae bacterium]
MSAAVGLYRPGGGWLHRLHPYPKLLLLAVAIVAPFALPAAASAGIIAIGLVGGLTGGLGRPFLWRAIVGSLPVVVPIVLINGFFFPGADDVLVALGPLRLTSEGLAFGLPIASRFLAAFVAVVAFATATRPDDLMAALVERGVDRGLAFVVLSALQAIPRLTARAHRIADAQRARGLDTGGSIVGRARGLLPLLGPLVVASLIDVRDRTLALEARAFSAPGPRTAYRTLVMRPIDTTVARLALLLLVGLAVIAGLRIGGWLP